MRGHDPVLADETVEGDRLRRRVALWLAGGDGRHPQVPLALADRSLHALFPEAARVDLVQAERISDFPFFLRGRLDEVEPEQLTLAEVVERVDPGLELLALPLVE